MEVVWLFLFLNTGTGAVSFIAVNLVLLLSSLHKPGMNGVATESPRPGWGQVHHFIIIIITEMCKAPPPRLKALNKHNTRNVHRDGKCYQ